MSESGVVDKFRRLYPNLDQVKHSLWKHVCSINRACLIGRPTDPP